MPDTNKKPTDGSNSIAEPITAVGSGDNDNGNDEKHPVGDPHASEPSKKKRINFDQVKAKGDRQEALAAEPEATVIPIRTPKSDEFFRCDPRPEMSMALNILVLKDEGEWYMIEEHVLNSIGHETSAKRMICFVCLTMTNLPFVYLIPLPDEQGKLNQWHKSAYNSMERAKAEWIRRQADKSNSQYTIQPAKPNVCPDPKWPEKSLEELLEQAFEDYYISDTDHPVLKRLGH